MNPAFEMNRANQFKMDSHEVAEDRCQRIPHSFIIELSNVHLVMKGSTQNSRKEEASKRPF